MGKAKAVFVTSWCGLVQVSEDAGKVGEWGGNTEFVPGKALVPLAAPPSTPASGSLSLSLDLPPENEFNRLLHEVVSIN